MIIDDFDDDYKRPEGGSSVVGVKKNYQDAWKKVLIEEFKLNKDYSVLEEEGEKDEKIDMSKLSQRVKKRIEQQSKYKELGKKLETITINDNFISQWNEARNDYLGEAEFGITSSGNRGYVECCELD